MEDRVQSWDRGSRSHEWNKDFELEHATVVDYGLRPAAVPRITDSVPAVRKFLNQCRHLTMVMVQLHDVWIFLILTRGGEVMLQSEVAEIEMTGFIGRETGTNRKRPRS
jgi:hypothetical protein